MSRTILFSFVAIAITACGGAPPPAPVIADKPPVEEKVDTGPTSMEQEIGGLNQEAMETAFAKLDVMPCIAQGSDKLDQLGGEFKLKLRIDKQGTARFVYLSSSTLGDRETEKCVLDLVRAKTWPKPVGGDGIAEKEFAIDPRKEPATIDAKKVQPIVLKARIDTMKCRRGVEGAFFATVYVRPDGQVVTAGVAVPNEKGEDAADCVVEAIRKMHIHPTASKPAKLSFEIR